MNERTVDIGKFGAMFKADIKRTSSAIKRGLIESAFVLEVLVSAKTPVDEGNTRAAWRTQITKDGANVSNDSPVVLFLEDGTRPHRPPLLPIVRWLARKHGVSTGIQSIDEAPPELVAMAYAVVEHIEEHGTKPHKMMQSSVPEILPVVKKRVERAIQKEIKK